MKHLLQVARGFKRIHDSRRVLRPKSVRVSILAEGCILR